MLFYTFIGSYFTLLRFGTHHYLQGLFNQQIIYQINKKSQADQREAKIKMLHTSPLLCFTLQPKFHGNNNIERLLGSVRTESQNWLLWLLLVQSFCFCFCQLSVEQSKPHYQYKCHVVDQQCYQSSKKQYKNNIFVNCLYLF